MYEVANIEWTYRQNISVIRCSGERDYFPANEMTLMQYTGLKDKNGREIYEGDLLKYPNGEIIQVIWMKNPASFSPKEIDLIHAPEVIGNIYENLELLKGGE